MREIALFLVVILGLIIVTPTRADTSVPTALPELCGDTYLGEEGCLYPSGNMPPNDYQLQIDEIDCYTGNKVILVGLGMSMMQNALNGFEPFLNQPEVNDDIVLINGAIGSNQQRWEDPNYFGWDRGIQALNSAGYSVDDPKCVMYHNAWSGPSGSFADYVAAMVATFEITNNIIQDKYPNVELILINSRHYALNPASKHPEPYAYWDGFAIKQLIENRINCTVDCGALLVWNAYQWDDEWANHSEYYCSDGLHLCGVGQTASGQIWHDYLSATFAWYLDSPIPTATPTIPPTATQTPIPMPTGGTPTPTASVTPFPNTPTPNPTIVWCGRACQTATAAAP